MKTEQSQYEIQANKFLADTGTAFQAEKIGHGFYFDDDKETRDIYNITLERNGQKWAFKFGQSVVNSDGPYLKKKQEEHRRKTGAFVTPNNLKPKKPSAYDVLAAITKYDPGTFENFCGDFGYETDSRKALKTYLAVQEEFNAVNRLFHGCLDELSEIQ